MREQDKREKLPGVTDLSTIAFSAYRPPFSLLGPIDGAVPEHKLVRGRHSDPTIHEVRQNTASTIDVPRGEKATIFTWGLAACTSMMVASRDESGLIRVTLSHFLTLDGYEHASALKLETAKHLADGRTPAEISVICAARGRTSADQRSIAISPNAIPQVADLRDSLGEALQGRCWNLQVIPYDADVERAQKGSGFIIRFGPSFVGNGSIELHNEYCGSVFRLPGA